MILILPAGAKHIKNLQHVIGSLKISIFFKDLHKAYSHLRGQINLDCTQTLKHCSKEELVLTSEGNTIANVHTNPDFLQQS